MGTKMQRALDNAQKARVVRLYRDLGVSPPVIAERMGVSPAIVYAALHEGGIDVSATTRAREKQSGKL